MTDKEKERLMRKLKTIAKKEIRISTERLAAPLSATASRIGGKPAVPKDFEWPRYAEPLYQDESAIKAFVKKIAGIKDSPQFCPPVPLAFIAQINLKDVANLDEENRLPKSGILSFFYELESQPWGMYMTDRGSARVFYFPDEAALTVAEPPEDLSTDWQSQEFALRFESRISLPSLGEYVYDDGEDYEWDDFQQCRAECGYFDSKKDYRDEEHIKMFGYPDVIQNPMEEECERVTMGFLRDENVSYTADAVYERSKDWTLLFQLPSKLDGDDFEFMFGDAGNIYFWIRKEDLRDCKFENVWLILQCY